jgi:hypothetical protein
MLAFSSRNLSLLPVIKTPRSSHAAVVSRLPSPALPLGPAALHPVQSFAILPRLSHAATNQSPFEDGVASS